MLLNIFEEIDVIARQNHGASPRLNAEVLRLPSVLASDITGDAGEDLLTIAVHESQPARLVDPSQSRHIDWIGVLDVFSSSQCICDIVPIFFSLHPNLSLRKQ